MSSTDIPEKIKVRLWVKAGGRCEYDGCNQPLWRDDLTMSEMNRAYIAHIIADKPSGSRGDPSLSSQFAADLTNLMLLCDAHHRLIDLEQVAEHPAVRLRRMKEVHAARIEAATGIRPDKR